MPIDDFEASPVVDDRGVVMTPPANAAEVVEAAEAKAESESTAPEPDAGEERDRNGRFRGRRAPSHDARPDDLPRIKELSATLREERIARRLDNGMRDVDEILVDIYPKATTEERARHRKAVEAQVTAYQPKVVKAPETVKVPAPLPEVKTSTFDEPEPTVEQFASEPDPYQAHLRALGKWDAKKEAFDAKQKADAEARTKAEAAQKAELETISKAWQDRVAKAKEDPTWEADAKKADAQIPSQSVLAFAILLDEDGPKMLRFLSAHQDLLDDLLLSSPPVTDATIAAMRRRLHSRMAGGKTGAPEPTPVAPLPRPPSPVRTTTMSPGADADPNTQDFDAHSSARARERRRMH